MDDRDGDGGLELGAQLDELLEEEEDVDEVGRHWYSLTSVRGSCFEFFKI